MQWARGSTLKECLVHDIKTLGEFLAVSQSNMKIMIGTFPSYPDDSATNLWGVKPYWFGLYHCSVWKSHQCHIIDYKVHIGLSMSTLISELMAAFSNPGPKWQRDSKDNPHLEILKITVLKWSTHGSIFLLACPLILASSESCETFVS